MTTYFQPVVIYLHPYLLHEKEETFQVIQDVANEYPTVLLCREQDGQFWCDKIFGASVVHTNGKVDASSVRQTLRSLGYTGPVRRTLFIATPDVVASAGYNQWGCTRTTYEPMKGLSRADFPLLIHRTCKWFAKDKR